MADRDEHLEVADALAQSMGLDEILLARDVERAAAAIVPVLRQTAEKAVAEHRDVVAAYIRDRAEQYDQSSGYTSALYDLAADVRDNEPNEAHAHGELDDLMVKRDFKTWKARAQVAERDLAASRSESEALRGRLQAAERDAFKAAANMVYAKRRFGASNTPEQGGAEAIWNAALNAAAWELELKGAASPSSGTREPTPTKEPT